METDTERKLKEFLRTPPDLTGKTAKEKAELLALSFIGYVLKPIGIDEETYQGCVVAFGSRRGKIEWEIESIEKYLISRGEK